jgi:hypothetical protein
MVKKAVFILFLLTCVNLTVNGQSNDYKKFIGKWVGNYEGNGATHTATVTFKEEGGKLIGVAESTEKEDGIPIDVEMLVIKGNAMKFELMSAIKYEGTLNDAGNIIEGILTGMNGNLVKLNLTKVVEPGSVKSFIGSWKCVITDSEMDKIIVLAISEKEGKLEGTIEIPEQNVGPFPLQNIKVEGNAISFEVLDGVLSYSGKYNPDKKAIEGTGVENGKATAANFLKDEKPVVK